MASCLLSQIRFIIKIFTENFGPTKHSPPYNTKIYQKTEIYTTDFQFYKLYYKRMSLKTQF